MTRATDEQIKQALTEASVEVIHAREERDHWRTSYETVQHEFRLVLAVLLGRQGTHKFVLTEAEANAVRRDLHLYAGNPESGVRVYELRVGEPQKIVLPPTGGLALPH